MRFNALNESLIIADDQTVRTRRPVLVCENETRVASCPLLLTFIEWMLVSESCMPLFFSLLFFLSLSLSLCLFFLSPSLSLCLGLSPWGAIFYRCICIYWRQKTVWKDFLRPLHTIVRPNQHWNCWYLKIKKFIDFPTFPVELTCAYHKLKCLWTRVDKGFNSNPPTFMRVNRDLNSLLNVQTNTKNAIITPCSFFSFFSVSKLLEFNDCCFTCIKRETHTRKNANNLKNLRSH